MQKTFFLFFMAIFFSITLHAHDSNFNTYGLIELPHPLHDVLRLKKELNLSDEQFAYFNEMLKTYPIAMIPKVEKMNSLESELQNTILSEKYDKKALLSKLESLNRLKNEITSEQIEVIEKMRSKLNENQWKLLKETLSTHSH